MQSRSAIAFVALALAACVMPPREQALNIRQQAPVVAGKASPAAVWPRANWWQSFSDTQLDGLIATALQSAPSLRTAKARIDAAEAASAVIQARGNVQLSASAAASRNRLSENGLISGDLLGFNWYNQAEAGLRLDIDFDWWGSERAAISAGIDRSRAAQAEAAASQLILVTAVAAEYLGWQNDGLRLDVGRELIAQLDKQRLLQKLRTKEGIDDAGLLYQLEMDLAQARDATSLLEASQSRHRLSLTALLGVAPDRLAWARRGIAKVPALEAPSDLGLGLISRRADVVASRWRVEAALQDVAEARAGYYPDLRLSALVGLSSLSASKLFSAGSQVASLGAALYLPIFDIRGVRARYGVRHADLELAAASYDEAVVGAAQNVAEQMLNCRTLLRRRQTIGDRLGAAEKLGAAATTRYREGSEDARARIGAEAQALRVRDTALQIDGELALARLGLIKALGGGVDMPIERARRSR